MSGNAHFRNPKAAVPVPRHGVGLAAVPPTPKTPRDKSGAIINGLVEELNRTWQLGLKARDDTWSPSKVSNTLESKIPGQLKRLWFYSIEDLDEALRQFQLQAPRSTYDKRLELLHGILKSWTPRTPSSGRVRPIDLQSSYETLRGPLKSLLLCECFGYLMSVEGHEAVGNFSSKFNITSINSFSFLRTRNLVHSPYSGFVEVEIDLSRHNARPDHGCFNIRFDCSGVCLALTR